MTYSYNYFIIIKESVSYNPFRIYYFSPHKICLINCCALQLQFLIKIFFLFAGIQTQSSEDSSLSDFLNETYTALSETSYESDGERMALIPTFNENYNVEVK